MLGARKSAEELKDQCQSVPPAVRHAIELDVLAAWDEHSQALFQDAISWTRSREAAEDAVQEVFFRYFLYRLGGNEVAHVRAWLIRVLRHHLVDAHRRQAASVALDDLPEIPAAGAAIEDLIHHAQQVQRLVCVLAPRERECLELRASGLQYHEIGKRMNLASGTVGALLTRAARKMRALGAAAGRRNGK